MSGQIGTIVELDPIDALGWIELDEGGRVRFGGTALRGFNPSPGVGSRVEVRGTKPGFKGVLKAVLVVPYCTPEEIARAVEAHRAAEAAAAEARRAEEAAKIAWPDFVRAHPRWSDVADACVPCARPAPRPELTHHPLFAPWHHEICTTAPTGVILAVPHDLHPDPIEPGPNDCFAHGRIAFLDEPRWPSCGVCARPLQMCLQVSPSVLADFIPGGRGLVALFCFECGAGNNQDQRVGHVRLVTPRHRVVGPEAWRSDAEKRLFSASQRVTPGAPQAVIPDEHWYRRRSERTKDTAASVLLGFEDAGHRLAGPFPEGASPNEIANLPAAYEAWLSEQPSLPWLGAWLGAVAHWDQYDATPSCAHGEMPHLLDYNGGQFLDGALHVFACREGRCELSFVPEL